MCGIFLLLKKSQGSFSEDFKEIVLSSFLLLKNRGPDKYLFRTIKLSNNLECLIGFHRLAINDVSDNGMQPFYKSSVQTYTMCNGEIYNYEKLLSKYPNFKPNSHSDCEILPYLFENYDFKDALNQLDAVFSLCHVDTLNSTVKLARDRIGVKPLFYAENDNYFALSSETKSLVNINIFNDIKQLEPSSFMTYDGNTFENSITPYTLLETYESHNNSYEECVSRVHDLLVESIKKRLSSDREIGCLLSGGLDSSLVSSILARELSKTGKKLHTFSIGFPDSTDIVYARKVSEHIGSEHHEYIIQYEDALKEIENVIKTIESYDTTTVRASTPMYMLCKWINENFPHKVIFSGEGSDELLCGYLYFHKAPTLQDAHNDSFRLMKELYKYDVLRADRCTAGNGLEFRDPFLDSELVNFVLGMAHDYKVPRDGYEKEILRRAFSYNNYLPDSVLWRRKAAFSDAVSSSEKPWYKWIQEYVSCLLFEEKPNDYGGTLESNYYKTLFYKNFSGYNPDIPLWLPKWSNVGNEPSATVLDIYKKEEH
jgi:asparagine synthase (glutamine-hydrolysing)